MITPHKHKLQIIWIIFVRGNQSPHQCGFMTIFTYILPRGPISSISLCAIMWPNMEPNNLSTFLTPNIGVIFPPLIFCPKASLPHLDVLVTPPQVASPVEAFFQTRSSVKILHCSQCKKCCGLQCNACSAILASECEPGETYQCMPVLGFWRRGAMLTCLRTI